MKIKIQITLLVLLTGLSFSAMCEDMAAMKQMMEQQIIASCNDSAFLSCVGSTQSKCVSSSKKAMSACDSLFPKDMATMDAGMTAFGDCIKQKNLKNMGISDQLFKKCDVAENEPPMDPEQGMAMFKQAMQQQAAMMGTDAVTLPIYKNATVMSHFSGQQGQQVIYNMMGKMIDGVLPAMTLSSPDSLKKIVSYYQSQLKGFKKYNIDSNVLLIESGPRDFNLMRDMQIYSTTPHVMVSSIPGDPERKIEIAYKK